MDLFKVTVFLFGTQSVWDENQFQLFSKDMLRCEIIEHKKNI